MTDQLPPMPVKPARPPRRTIGELIPGMLLPVLAIAALGMTSWSMYTLLHDGARAPWWIAVFGVGIFDLTALQAAHLVKARRCDPVRAAGAQLLMVVAVGASAAVNGFHGWQLAGWPVAVVLGAAPVMFEVAFAVKHRTFAALMWILFPRATFQGLRTEVWSWVALRVTTATPTTPIAASVGPVATPTTPAATGVVPQVTLGVASDIVHGQAIGGVATGVVKMEGLAMLAQGRTTTDVAEALRVSVRTVQRWQKV